MANPNIVSVTQIYGFVTGLTASTGYQTIVSNATGSNLIYKINTIMCANINGTSPADITLELVKNGTVLKIAHTISVPADATLVIISKDTSIYLNENDSIRTIASANSWIDVTCSYETISMS